MLRAAILISAAILTAASLAAAEPAGLPTGDPAGTPGNVRPRDDLMLGGVHFDFIPRHSNFDGIVTRGRNDSLGFIEQIERVWGRAVNDAADSGRSDSGRNRWAGPEAILHYTFDPDLARDLLVMARTIRLNRQPLSAASAGAKD